MHGHHLTQPRLCFNLKKSLNMKGEWFKDIPLNSPLHRSLHHEDRCAAMNGYIVSDNSILKVCVC